MGSSLYLLVEFVLPVFEVIYTDVLSSATTATETSHLPQRACPPTHALQSSSVCLGLGSCVFLVQEDWHTQLQALCTLSAQAFQSGPHQPCPGGGGTSVLVKDQCHLVKVRDLPTAFKSGRYN